MTTLSQFVALHFVYRRLLLGCGFLPLLTLIAPIILWVYLGVWNLLSGGYAGLTHLLSLGIAVLAYHGIHTLSKSEESRQRALHVNRQYVPVLMICCALLIHVTASSLGLRSFSGPYSWVFSFRQSLRMSFVLTLLGIAVLARFMGPQSLGKYGTNVCCIICQLTYQRAVPRSSSLLHCPVGAEPRLCSIARYLERPTIDCATR
jgi:hypothetical protein